MSGRVIVTGVAGFIGSHLCERLLGEGFEVTGIDSFTDYYDPRRKRENIEDSLGNGRFRLIERDLNDCDLAGLFDGVGCVFHLAAQAGVRRSWGSEFKHYTEANILATQSVLEAIKEAGSVKLVHSSSSSVYGETKDLPMKEGHRLSPVSPYGATKLSAEHLCELYRINFDVDYTLLRYFTVYGPRQRPDMAFSRFITGALEGDGIEVYGDGTQTRDFTFVSDAVEANMAAMRYGGQERVFNIGGGSRISILDVIRIMEDQMSIKLDVRLLDPARGDVTDTWADTTRAREELGFEPSVSIENGIGEEIAWYRARHESSEGREA